MSNAIGWHVLGAGALGSLFAAQLQQAGRHCHLIGRAGGRTETRLVELDRPVRLKVEPADQLPAGSIRYLMITTKAWAVADALEAVLPALHRTAVVISCCNGLGFDEAIKEIRPETRLLRAVSTEGAHRAKQRVVYAGRGQTLLGDPGNAAEPAWFSASLAGVGNWRWDARIQEALWRKFAVNCAINALTAVHDCRNGELLERQGLRKELAALCGEIERAMRQLELWPFSKSLLPAVLAVCEKTAANHSSMLQDRRAGRRTEIDFLNGYLLQLATARGLVLPHNTRLVTAVGSS